MGPYGSENLIFPTASEKPFIPVAPPSITRGQDSFNSSFAILI